MQLKIFKGDFDIERNDREKAQSEITTLEAEVVKLVEKLKKQEGRMIQKEKEAAALKESNRELQRKYEHLHHKLQKQSKYEGSNYDIHFHGEREERRRRNTPSPVDRQIGKPSATYCVFISSRVSAWEGDYKMHHLCVCDSVSHRCLQNYYSYRFFCQLIVLMNFHAPEMFLFWVLWT